MISMWESALTGPNSRPRVNTVPEYSRRLLTNPWGITCDRTACHSSGIAMHPVTSFCRNWDTAGCANVGAKKKTLRENEIRLHQCNVLDTSRESCFGSFRKPSLSLPLDSITIPINVYQNTHKSNIAFYIVISCLVSLHPGDRQSLTTSSPS